MDESQVTVPTRNDDFFQDANATCFSLSWTIGMNPKVPLLNLSVGGKTRYFYAAGNVGVIGTGSGKAQTLLQGHVSAIDSAGISHDKQWLVTAESKPNIFLIVWNTYTAKSVKYLTSTEETGVIRVCISRDGKLIALLTDAPNQKIIVWRWSNHDASPIVLSSLPITCERQSWFTMLEDRSIFYSIGIDSAIFYRKAAAERLSRTDKCSSPVPQKETTHVQMEIHRDFQRKLGQRLGQIIFCYMMPSKREAVVITSTGIDEAVLQYGYASLEPRESGLLRDRVRQWHRSCRSTPRELWTADIHSSNDQNETFTRFTTRYHLHRRIQSSYHHRHSSITSSRLRS